VKSKEQSVKNNYFKKEPDKQIKITANEINYNTINLSNCDNPFKSTFKLKEYEETDSEDHSNDCDTGKKKKKEKRRISWISSNDEFFRIFKIKRRFE